jgi:hypothetical protein
VPSPLLPPPFLHSRIGNHFIQLAKEDMRQHIKNLPDADLAYFTEGIIFFSEAGIPFPVEVFLFHGEKTVFSEVSFFRVHFLGHMVQF